MTCSSYTVPNSPRRMADSGDRVLSSDDFERTEQRQESFLTRNLNGTDSSVRRSSGEISGYSNVGAKDITQLLGNQFESQKELSKHFIFESMLNEKVSVERFECLPQNCKNFVTLFFKECLGFDISERKKGMPVSSKFLILENLKQGDLNQQAKARKSLSFGVGCYLFGLQKQLHVTNSELDQEKTIKILYERVHDDSTDTEKLERFIETLNKIKDEAT